MGIRKQVCVCAAVLAVILLAGSGTAVSKTAEIQVMTSGVQPISREIRPRPGRRPFLKLLNGQWPMRFHRWYHPRCLPRTWRFCIPGFCLRPRIISSRSRCWGDHPSGPVPGGGGIRVHSGLLEQTLAEAGILKTETEQPKVLLLIAEQTAQDLLPKYWWATTRNRITLMRKSGWRKCWRKNGFR